MAREKIRYIFTVVIVGILLFSVIVLPFFYSFNETQYTIMITDKERVNSGSSSKYLVFGEDENGELLVFQNTDNLLRGKWNSSDIYGKLKIGNTYRVKVVGYRIPFLSSYKNIISYEETEGYDG